MANFIAQCVYISTKHSKCLVGSNAGDEIAVVVERYNGHHKALRVDREVRLTVVHPEVVERVESRMTGRFDP
jgi:hypothetical protein